MTKIGSTSLTVSGKVGEFQFTFLQQEHLPFLLEVRNECCEFLHDNRCFSLEEAVDWYTSSKPEYWLILFRGVRIGYFRVSDVSETHKRALVGADLHKDFRGQGLGERAWRAFLGFAFEAFDFHKISLEVLSINQRALNLYVKLGFIEEGVKRHDIRRAGKWIDSILMSMLREEFFQASRL